MPENENFDSQVLQAIAYESTDFSGVMRRLNIERGQERKLDRALQRLRKAGKITFKGKWQVKNGD